MPSGTHGSGINQSSFYSSQTHSIHNGGPVGSANYEKVQARYGVGKDFSGNLRNMNHGGAHNSHYDAQGANQHMMTGGSGGMMSQHQQQDDIKSNGFQQATPYRHRMRGERSFHNLNMQENQTLDDI